MLRSAPWWPVAGVLAGAAALLAVAVGAGQGTAAQLSALLALAATGAASAYLLDEEAAEVADATPTSQPRRACWRLLASVVPAATAAAGLVALDLRDPSTHWLRLLPLAAGSIATGVAAAAVLRRRGVPAPGDLAGVLALCGLVLVVLVDPLRRWLPMNPLGGPDLAARSSAAWVVWVAVCAAATVLSVRDPGR